MDNKPNPQEVFVTVLNTDNYLPGVLVLEKSIRDLCSHQLFVLASQGLNESTYKALNSRGISYGFADDIPVDPTLFDNVKTEFSHWKKTLFKMRIFELTQYDKIVFIDSDIILLEPVDDLFDWPDMSATIAGRSYPGNESWSTLNSGVMVIIPRENFVDYLVDLVPVVAAKKPSFGDQDVLSEYFAGWENDEPRHIPEANNVFFDHYQFYLKHGGVKALHFIGARKPWMMKWRDLAVHFLRCIIKGNTKGVDMLKHYRRYLRRVYADG